MSKRLQKIEVVLAALAMAGCAESQYMAWGTTPEDDLNAGAVDEVVQTPPTTESQPAPLAGYPNAGIPPEDQNYNPYDYSPYGENPNDYSYDEPYDDSYYEGWVNPPGYYWPDDSIDYWGGYWPGSVIVVHPHDNHHEVHHGRDFRNDLRGSYHASDRGRPRVNAGVGVVRNHPVYRNTTPYRGSPVFRGYAQPPRGASMGRAPARFAGPSRGVAHGSGSGRGGGRR